MQVIEFISNMFSLANDMLDIVFLWGGIILPFTYPIYFFVTNFEKYAKEQKNRELLSQTIILVLIVAAMAPIWAIPEIAFLAIAWTRKLSLLDELAK